MEYRKYKTVTNIIDNIKNSDYEDFDFAEDFVSSKNKYSFFSEDVLFIADILGQTVAHEMAKSSFRFNPIIHKDILLLANKDGETVAH
jgi:uncharacterized protein YfkK (UPF0435 family)